MGHMKPVSPKALQAFQRWGKEGGKKRAQRLSASKRRTISRHAACVRWNREPENDVLLPSVRLNEALWDDPVYLEEVLSHGTLREWRELHRRIDDRPFGPEALALEKVLNATHAYGTTFLWKGMLKRRQGIFS